MTLSELSQPTFGLRFDGNHLPWPQELGQAPADWADVVFLSYDRYPFLDDSLWNEIVIDENGKLYIEFHDLTLVEDKTGALGFKAEVKNMKLKSLEDFTGQITFEAYIPNDSSTEDYLLVCMLTAVKGKLDSVEIHTKQAVENGSRKKNVEKIQKQINKTITRQSAWWYNYLYKPYKVTIYAVYHVLNFILAIPLWLLEKLVRLITPI